MQTITATYILKYAIDFADYYKFDERGQCWNMRSGRQIKKVYCGGSLGYCINGKFHSLTYLRKHLVKIKNEQLPF